MPPISSTIRSASSRIAAKSPRERVSTPETSGRRPVIAATWSARSASSAAKADPTVPWPSSPTLNDVSPMQVLEGLAPHHEPGAPAGAEDDRRARDAVVVVGHRVGVGAGDRHGEDVADPWIRQPRLADQHVAGLAVLAHDRAGRARSAHAV